MTKTEQALAIVNQIEIDAVKAARQVKAACDTVRKELHLRQELVEDPKMSKLPGMHAAISSAVAAGKASMAAINVQSEADVTALINAADSVEVE